MMAPPLALLPSPLASEGPMVRGTGGVPWLACGRWKRRGLSGCALETCPGYFLGNLVDERFAATDLRQAERGRS